MNKADRSKQTDKQTQTDMTCIQTEVDRLKETRSVGEITGKYSTDRHMYTGKHTYADTMEKQRCAQLIKRMPKIARSHAQYTRSRENKVYK